MKVKVFVLAALLCGALFGVASCTQADEPTVQTSLTDIDDIIDDETPL